MALKITKGVNKRAQRVIVYGPEGIGKSTFASKFPRPLFIDTEGSTDHMDVERVERPSSWTMLLAMIKEFCAYPGPYKTLVIDTIDWAEQLCIDHICAKAGKSSIESFGYGVGYTYLLDEMGKFLNVIDEVIANGVNVLFTAHAQVRKYEQPDELGAYDRYELKLGRKTTSKTAALIKEWSDMLLFVNYKNNIITTNDGKTRATQGKRVMYTTHTPQWDAKNRYGLAPELPFEYEHIAKCIPDDILSDALQETFGGVKTEAEAIKVMEEAEEEFIPFEMKTQTNSAVPKALQDLMEKDSITIEQIQKVAAARGQYPANTPFENYDPAWVQGWLIPFWNNLVDYIRANNL